MVYNKKIRKLKELNMQTEIQYTVLNDQRRNSNCCK